MKKEDWTVLAVWCDYLIDSCKVSWHRVAWCDIQEARMYVQDKLGDTSCLN